MRSPLPTPVLVGILLLMFLPASTAGPADSKAAGTGGGSPSASAPPPPSRQADAGSEAQPAQKEKVRVYTNADLEKLPPIPGQQAPAAPTPESEAEWNRINAFIERERAYEMQRQDRQMAREVMNQEEKARNEWAEAPHYWLPTAVYSYYPGVCSWPGCGGPPPRPQPTNVFEPLSQRGIRTATDLYRESVRNSAARRANMP